MIPDDTFRVERSRFHKEECWAVAVRVGEEEWNWVAIYYADTEREARQKLQWFVDRMKAYVVGV